MHDASPEFFDPSSEGIEFTEQGLKWMQRGENVLYQRPLGPWHEVLAQRQVQGLSEFSTPALERLPPP
jgi:hypothetical protein